MNPKRSVNLVYFIATGVLYLALGGVLIALRNRLEGMESVAPIMGGACLIYGTFRCYTAYAKDRQARREDAYDNLRRGRGV